MTATLPSPVDVPARVARAKRFLMCRPDHFDVTYAINPWMDTSRPVDRDLALRQWETLRAAYEAKGHRVEVVDGVVGLPDMVFAANGGFAVGDRAMAATFAHVERQPEGDAYHAWFTAAGFTSTTRAVAVNEGEGDLLRVGNLILAGHGFRSSTQAHHEVREFFGLPVISLELVDPRFYHLDTALCVLDDHNVAYYPAAFAPQAQRLLEQLFPDAVIATDADAEVLGLNAVSDGRHVFLTDAATGMHAALRERGYEPVGIDLGELLKAGGSVKCCTLELHP
ncbi:MULTISPECIES: dimethylargininase [Nocardioides]|nr:dimethylargininase [Nocardioides sp. CGMCC 1.13656]